MRQQILYNLADDLSCIIVKDNGAQQADWKAPTTPTADLQITLQSIDSKQQTILETVAESLNYAPSSSKDLICQQQSYSQIEKVTMQLYRIFGKASFKSRSQRILAVRLAQPSSVRNPGAILAILKTGAGKTAAYVIASSICNNLITFVIVPTIALLSQMLHQLTELQLSCHLWKKDDIERHTNFQLLSMESAVSSEFLNYAGNLARQGKVYRMIIDEAHTPLVWSLFMKSGLRLHRLLEVDAEIVFLTATMPPLIMNSFLDLYQLNHMNNGVQQANVEIMRNETNRGELCYFRNIAKNENELLQIPYRFVFSLMQQLIKKVLTQDVSF